MSAKCAGLAPECWIMCNCVCGSTCLFASGVFFCVTHRVLVVPLWPFSQRQVPRTLGKLLANCCATLFLCSPGSFAVGQSICLSSLFISLSICFSVYPSIHLSIFLPRSLSLSLSLCLSLCLSLSLSLSLFLCRKNSYLPSQLSFYPSIYQSMSMIRNCWA